MPSLEVRYIPERTQHISRGGFSYKDLAEFLETGFRSSSRLLVAQNFTMPAMSPTMTDGNIASWKVKEGINCFFLGWLNCADGHEIGDSFSTGDVLLEIETDKAKMDVEAQDYGKMAKITQQAGAKGVRVGARIAILVENDDDLSTLELPDAAPSAQAFPSEDILKASDPGAEAATSSKEQEATPTKRTKSTSSSSSPSDAKPQKQVYPLYPSIAQLLHEKSLPLSEADKIPASGPKGRLLKGDVLAYLGEIDKSYSSEQSARITKLGHLDLSNVKAVPSKEAAIPPPSKPAPPPREEEPLDSEIAISISLTSVIAVQKRIQDTLGVTLPLSTFLARATELANEDLPRSNTPPTTDELFNNVLGLNKVGNKVSRGDYTPQITALPSRPISSERVGPKRKEKEADVYDILTRKPTPSPTRKIGVPPAGIMGGSKAGDSTNVFSVGAVKGEEKKARTFLERMKTILQVEPGRLIL